MILGLSCGLLAIAPVDMVGARVAAEDNLHAPVQRFVNDYCVECHRGQLAEGGLRLESLASPSPDSESLEPWVQVHDRLRAGEMPPADAAQPTPDRVQAVLESLSTLLHGVSRQRQQAVGRVPLRRLNRVEYEYTLRELLALPHLEVKDILPADNRASGFDHVASAQDFSYVQMARFLDAASEALDQAMRLGPSPATQRERFPANIDGRFAQVLNKQREAVAVGEAVGLLRQPNSAQAPWTWNRFKPPVDGMYRIRMRGFGFVWDQGQVLPSERAHVVSFFCIHGSAKRPLVTLDLPAGAENSEAVEFEAFLKQGDLLEVRFPRLDDRNKPESLPIEQYTAPGVALEWLEVEGPLLDAWPPESYRRLFGDLPVREWTADSTCRQPALPMIVNGNGKRATRMAANPNKTTLYEVVSADREADASRLLLDFARRAFRRPVAEAEIGDALALVKIKLDQHDCFQEAMRIGFQTLLCSPQFLFLREPPGRLDDYALAARLSYFLWRSPPDIELVRLAEERRLRDPQRLRLQVERLLLDARSQRFVEDFTGQWLDLHRITITEPDEVLYPEYDRLLLDSMVQETHAYFAEMLDSDLGVRQIVASDFVLINERLAELYDIPEVFGNRLRRVAIPEHSPRGGLWTQASILKVTANGTTTSPVTRGAWISDRLLGQPMPPPPANVKAVEPDLRGTITIRQQLQQHREEDSCSVCHRVIDPPGFALESFDVIGGWRERYRCLENGDPVEPEQQAGRPVRYQWGLPVDSSGRMPDGRTFANVHDLRAILLQQQEVLARNLVERLVVYATGGGLQFADRQAIDGIVQSTRASGWGLRSLIHAVVQSEPFQMK